MITLDSTTLQNLESLFFPAVYALVNKKTKTIWISRTKCLADGLLRTIRSIREGNHKIKSLDGWEPLYLYSGEGLLYAYSSKCHEYKEAGYTLLNRLVKYTLKKKFQKQSSGKYKVLVVLGTRNYDLSTLGEFMTVKEADEFIRTCEKTN